MWKMQSPCGRVQPASVSMQTCSRLSLAASHRHRLRPCEAYVTAPPAPTAVKSLKVGLLEAVSGTDRGIFGLPAAKRTHILDLISQLEANNPVSAPTEHLGMCHGRWQLLFSTITITGVKRTKLGLRDFIKLGEFIQTIDTTNSLAINTVSFSVTGLSMIGGALTITASYAPSLPKRVDITFKDAVLNPAALQKLFEANYDLLLSIFNPQGHLDITYLDDEHRVGRDDKGNVYLLKRLD